MARHHDERCFGCGRANLFGLLLEVQSEAPAAVRGRCFIKQDHQGAGPGFAHEGVVTTALIEAMALACGPNARAQEVEVQLEGVASIGAFVEVQAAAEAEAGGSWRASASAACDGSPVASARGRYLA